MNWDSSLLIHAGAAIYILAFLIRDEMILRLMVLAGTVLYILYYYMFPDQPLWDAIVTSVILIGANLVVLGRIVLERTTFSMSDEERDLFTGFPNFNPGQFRKMLGKITWHEAAEDVLLTQQGQPLDRLYFIIDGPVNVTKDTHQFNVSARNFIGEISYVLAENPSATVVAPSGTRYASWVKADLDAMSRRDPAFGNALGALLSDDLARKLSGSVQPVADYT